MRVCWAQHKWAWLFTELNIINEVADFDFVEYYLQIAAFLSSPHNGPFHTKISYCCVSYHHTWPLRALCVTFAISDMTYARVFLATSFFLLQDICLPILGPSLRYGPSSLLS